jgi:Tol biopolymer transport system component
VAFYSDSSNLVSDDTNGDRDIFVHDAVTGSTTRVSVVASDGTQGNNASIHPSISADGRYVAFDSSASNLIPNDTNARGDVFVHDMVTGSTTRNDASGGWALLEKESKRMNWEFIGSAPCPIVIHLTSDERDS